MRRAVSITLALLLISATAHALLGKRMGMVGQQHTLSIPVTIGLGNLVANEPTSTAVTGVSESVLLWNIGVSGEGAKSITGVNQTSTLGNIVVASTGNINLSGIAELITLGSVAPPQNYQTYTWYNSFQGWPNASLWYSSADGGCGNGTPQSGCSYPGDSYSYHTKATSGASSLDITCSGGKSITFWYRADSLATTSYFQVSGGSANYFTNTGGFSGSWVQMTIGIPNTGDISRTLTFYVNNSSSNIQISHMVIPIP